MPIKGETDAVRLPLLGKIRLGTREKDDGRIYFAPSGHFICPDEVKKVFGEKPKELRIMFPTEDETQWASQYFRCYSETGSLICRGDGETALARVETIGRERSSKEKIITKLLEMPCNPDRCPCHRRGYCHRVMNLQFFLPDCPGFGVYHLDTSSYHSMLKINSMINLTRSICGRVSMVPLSLQLVEQETGLEGWPNVLDIIFPYSPAKMQRMAQGLTALAFLLPPPDREAPDDLSPARPRKASETAQTIASLDEKLLDLWVRTKNKVYHFEIQDSQIASWFDKNYHLEVGLLDFDPPRPPAKLTIEMLSAFCQSIDRYAGR
ncbi:hypothetical protein ACFLXD_03465 [Chloroflexota bacterium]